MPLKQSKAKTAKIIMYVKQKQKNNYIIVWKRL